MGQQSRHNKLQITIYNLLEAKDRKGKAAAAVNGFLIALIIINIAAFVLQTVESLYNEYAYWFDVILYVSLVVFTLEYLLRLWVCVLNESGLYRHPFKGRLRFMITPMALLDLAVLLPFYAATLFGMDLRFLRLIRLLWVLKITRYLPAMGSLGRVLKRERRTLVAVISLMFIMLFIASSLIYLLEHDDQPEKFASIPHAMWWGMATLTTVGYGDVVPITPLGQALGMVIMLLGIGTFALPAGVLASAFAEERKRRDFLRSWNLVAQVPFFTVLDAHEIARIAHLLHPREVLPSEVIFRIGEEGDSMFFIVSGEVEVLLEPEPIRYTKGAFFGEISLLFNVPRTATVVASRRSDLLELDAQELHRLLDANPKLKSRILKIATQRYDQVPHGQDINYS